MALYYLFGMEEVESRSSVDVVILAVFWLLLVAILVALVGSTLLLCAMIRDDRRDATARVMALRGGGGEDHKY